MLLNQLPCISVFPKYERLPYLSLEGLVSVFRPGIQYKLAGYNTSVAETGGPGNAAADGHDPKQVPYFLDALAIESQAAFLPRFHWGFFLKYCDLG
jgi:hypothetical protein